MTAQHPIALLIAILARHAACVVISHPKPPQKFMAKLPALHGGKLGTMPVHMFQADCALAVGTSSKRLGMPGAGMEPGNMTFETVLKDGFYNVDCVDDYMFAHGDKFGNNKFSYELGEVSNVSIVHYSMHVAKEDQQPMSHEVCFTFCRTIPDMTFFGIHNGRDCYCTPYYQSIEGDDSMCDAVCEGNPTTMCGSKTKSSIFGMHQCNSVATDVSSSDQRMADIKVEVTDLGAAVKSTSHVIQHKAAEYQSKFGHAADAVAADLMQTAKVYAGKLAEAATAAEKLEGDMTTLKNSADALTGFESSEQVAAAEGLVSKMEAATAAGKKQTAELQALQSKAAPTVDETANHSQQYYPVMYFIDKQFDSKPSSCGGTPVGDPLMGSVEACAQKCDADVHSCVGFSYFPGQGVYMGLCFLMSKLESVTYWDGCQDATKGESVQCLAKLSKFEGTSVKPDPSGKCEKCLKTAAKADRCFE